MFIEYIEYSKHMKYKIYYNNNIFFKNIYI